MPPIIGKHYLKEGLHGLMGVLPRQRKCTSTMERAMGGTGHKKIHHHHTANEFISDLKE